VTDLSDPAWPFSSKGWGSAADPTPLCSGDAPKGKLVAVFGT